MRRIKVILAVAALLVAMVVASAAPAFAHNNNDNNRNDDRDFNNCCFSSFENESSFFPFFSGFNTFGEDDDFFNTGFNGINNNGFDGNGVFMG